MCTCYQNYIHVYTCMYIYASVVGIVVATGGQPGGGLVVAAVAVIVTLKRGPGAGLAGKVWKNVSYILLIQGRRQVGAWGC